VAISSFTQADILAGLVRFVHNGAGTPGFSIFVSDGGANIGPFAANITFNAGGGFTPPPPPPGSGGPSGVTPLPPPSAPPAPASGPGQSAFAFLRGPTTPQESGGESALVTQVAQPPAGVLKADRVFVPTMGMPSVRAQMDVIETNPQRTQPQVELLRTEMQVLPTGKDAFDLTEEERAHIEVVLNSVRVSGLAISVGAVWWAARAVGLMASLLTVTPAWRHVDPLPVLGRDEEDKEPWDEAEEKDKEKQDEEHRAAWVLDEREAPS
jgi:hypothetical protein